MSFYNDMVEYAIYNAENDISDNISSEIFKIEGMSGRKNRIFLNSLMKSEKIKYLEIGSWKGSTLCSALYNNYPKYACAIDNFSQWWSEDSPSLYFHENTKKFIKCDFDFFDVNCFLFNKNLIKEKINVYFYDGDHKEEDHYKALEYYYDIFDDEFIFICDDWNWLDVKIGTYRAIRDLNLNICFSTEKKSSFNGDETGWWNGLLISILKKSK